MSARDDALAAAKDALRSPYGEGLTASVQDLLEDAGPTAVIGTVIDAIPSPVLAALAVERGGMVQVGWGGCTEHLDCDDAGHEWSLMHEDGRPLLCSDHPVWPVYRLTETPVSRQRCGAGHSCCTDPAGPPVHDHFLTPGDCPACGYDDTESDRG